MKRSTFLKTIAASAIVPAVIDKQLAYGAHPGSILGKMAAMATDTDHVLVIINLSGGNDGLNTVIPIDQYSNLSKARSNVLIPQNKVLSINGTANTGLHPSLTDFRNLYNNGKLKIVQSVGYPDQNYSHFRSTDIWFSASDADKYVNTGIAGRYLNYEFPNYPNGYPNTSNPDPLAIQVGPLVSLLFQGPTFNLGMAINNPNDVYNPTPGIADAAPNGISGEYLTFVRTIASQTSSYTKVIKAAADKVTTQKPYPANNSLADQLKVVAKLIAGGLKTRIYMVSVGGYDTHSTQVDKTDTTKGIHANLLKDLSAAVGAFQTDCEFLNIDTRVVGLTVSEFGRRIKSNDSGGTDHGAAAPMFVFGTPIDGGKILGSNPSIASTVGVEDNLPMQYDFRSVYATILRDWFCLSDTNVQSLMLKNFNYLPLLSQSCNASTVQLPSNSGLRLIKAWPIPTSGNLTIQFVSEGGFNQIDLLTMAGQTIQKLHAAQTAPGTYTIKADISNLASGNYYLRYSNLDKQQSVMVIR